MIYAGQGDSIESAVQAAMAAMASAGATPGVGEPITLPSVEGPLGAPQGLNYGSPASVGNHGTSLPPE